MSDSIAEAAAADDPAARLAALQAEQMRLLAEIRLADGVFGPAQRRELARQLRRVEREISRLQGRKLPFFFR